MYKRVLKTVGLLTVISFLGACSNGGSGAKTFIVSPAGVSQDGCLNMGLLLTQMRNFPDNTQARLFTEDVTVTSADNERGVFPLVATRGIYGIADKPFSQVNPFYAATQPDCHTLVTTTQEGSQNQYDIVDGGSDYLVMKQYQMVDDGSTTPPTQKKKEIKTINLKLKSSQEMEIITDAISMDVCHFQTEAHVHYAQVLRWGAGDIYHPEETVSASMLAKVAEANVSVAPEISEMIQQGGDQNISVPVDVLKTLAQSEVKVEVLTCPGNVPNPDAATIPVSSNTTIDTSSGAPGSGGAVPTPTPSPIIR